MAVYVDEARWRYGRMVMCHMWADTVDELLEMADTLGLSRTYLQEPPRASWVHFDISKTKRILAVAAGAIETDEIEPIIHCAKLAGKTSRVYELKRIRRMRLL